MGGEPEPPADAVPPDQNVANPNPPDQNPQKAEVVPLPMDGPARNRLNRLLKNIAIMLSFASANGIALPDDLNEMIGTLLKHPDAARDPSASLFCE